MTTNTSPPWGNTGWKPTPGPADGRFQPGQSGNAAGKVKGTLNKRTLLAELLEEGSDKVCKAMLTLAENGDVGAARLVLERVFPPKRPDGTRVKFKLDTTLTLVGQAGQVIEAMAGGEIDIEVGQVFLQAIGAYAKLKETDELSQRIESLEQQAMAAATAGHVLGRVMQTAEAAP